MAWELQRPDWEQEAARLDGAAVNLAWEEDVALVDMAVAQGQHARLQQLERLQV